MSGELSFELCLDRDGREYRYKGSSESRLLGLSGPSGAGKTTLLRLLAGLENPDSGIIKLGEATLLDIRAGINLPPEKRRIGMVFQDDRLFPHLTVEKNINFGFPRTGHRQGGSPTPNPRPLIDLLEIGDLLKRRPQKLSGGERQRVALARALVARPDCLLLDEPFSALDERMKRRLLPVLRDIQRAMDIPMLMVSHNECDMARIADRVFRIDDGVMHPGTRSVRTVEVAS